MGFFKEFKEFAMKGNVMDMAVGVIIGGAFGKIVSSLVNDILMPPIGALLGNVNFTDLRLDISKIRDMSQAVGEVVNEVTPDGVNIAGKAPRHWNRSIGTTGLSSSSASTLRFWLSAFS